MSTQPKFVLFKRGNRMSGPLRAQELALVLENEPLSAQSGIMVLPEKAAIPKEIAASAPAPASPRPRVTPVSRPRPQLVSPARKSTKQNFHISAALAIGGLALSGLVARSYHWERPTRVTVEAPAPAEPKLSDPGADLLREYRRHVDRGEFKSALKSIERYRKEFAKSDDIASLVEYAGLLLQLEGPSPMVWRWLTQAKEKAPTPKLQGLAEAWLGYFCLATGSDTNQAEEHLRSAIALTTEEADAAPMHFNLARALFNQKRYTEALLQLQWVQKRKPNLWMSFLYEGRARLAMGDRVGALAAFEKVTFLNPDRWMGHIYLTVFAEYIGDHAAAIAQLNKMFLADPDFEWMTPAPLGYWQERPDYAEYLRIFDRVAPHAPPGWRNVARAYLVYLGQDARPPFPAVGVQAEMPANQLWNLFYARSLLSMPSPGVFEMQATAEALGFLDNYYSHALRGLLLDRLGRTEAAIAELQAAYQLQPTSPLTAFRLAELYAQKGEEARGKRAVALLPMLLMTYSTENSRFPLLK